MIPPQSFEGRECIEKPVRFNAFCLSGDIDHHRFTEQGDGVSGDAASSATRRLTMQRAAAAIRPISTWPPRRLHHPQTALCRRVCVSAICECVSTIVCVSVYTCLGYWLCERLDVILRTRPFRQTAPSGSKLERFACNMGGKTGLSLYKDTRHRSGPS